MRIPAVIAGLMALFMSVAAAHAGELKTSVAAGVVIDDPSRIIAQLRSEPQLDVEDTFFVAWQVALDGSAETSVIQVVRESGATPWLRAEFRSPAPLEEHISELESELRELAALARAAGSGAFVQGVWEPTGGTPTAKDHAFLLKKAAVATTGAAPDAQFVGGPFGADPRYLQDVYGEEVAAYLDLVALKPEAGVGAAISVLADLDPGKPVVLDSVEWPSEPMLSVARVAEGAAVGCAVVLFDADDSRPLDLTALKVMARELRGQPVLDSASAPQGTARVWAFVLENLDLRVIAFPGPGQKSLELGFDDLQLGAPDRVDLRSGDVDPLYDVQRTARRIKVTIDEPDDVVLLRLERRAAIDEDFFGGEIDIEGDRQMPVEEILRRLQAVEDDQARRLDHYQARRTIHFRLQAVQGAIEVGYAGDFFFRRGSGFDWVWQDFFVSGVKWRSKRMPEVPLIQPEKVASLPAEIRLTKDYRYRLRGTDIVEGRDCWVIDFRPIDAAPGRNLYRGTVWVDREIYARVRTRATQIGLEGAVLSNEEIFTFTPLDADGRPTAWSRDAFILPLVISGQQTFSILSSTLPVEIETVLTDVRINGGNFDQNREAALASEATMLRETDEGLRFLRTDKSGERYVENKLDSDRLFLLGGVFWDESVDFPIPLLGVNYLDLDVRDTGAQFNLFFAGAVVNGSIADPRLFGSRWNGGATFGGLFFKATDELYRDGSVVPEENVKSRQAYASVYVGRPLGKFLSFEATYRLRYNDYDRADDTAEDFVVPPDTSTHVFKGEVQYNRRGYRLGLSAAANHRSTWAYWGLPGNDEYDPDQQDYLRWQAFFTKTWWLANFRSIGLTLEHLDGERLDRFSGYDFGIFGDSSVAGYPSGLVRAERAEGAHLSYGLNYFDKIRFQVQGDAVWATNASTGLDHELLAGIGVNGTLTLPWQLIMNFDVGYALAGPGQGGVALRISFLRLFPGTR